MIVTPEELRALLDDERSGDRLPRGAIDLTLADRLDDGDEDEDGGRLLGGLL